MNLSFICSFIATSNFLSKRHNSPFFSKKQGNTDIFTNPNKKAPNIFRINKGTTIEVPIEGDGRIKNEYDVLKKITRVLKFHNADKILNERPLRHYPSHHYKRLIKQRKGFKISETRREAYFRKHMEIPREDDVAYLHEKHLDKILEAVYSYDEWLNKVKKRAMESSNSDKNGNK